MKDKLLSWYAQNKRDLPWRWRGGVYAVLVSEMMLQQTTVETALKYYEPFLSRFPDVFALAAADEQQVLACWQGLGYYSRARNLHALAKQVANECGGVFPDTLAGWRGLPGVGPYMAGALMSIALGQPHPAVDGNVLRVISRVFALRTDIATPAARRQAEEKVRALMPHGHAGDFTQALMELGALVCRPVSPGCEGCPWREDCRAYAGRIVDELPVRSPRAAVKTVALWAALVETADKVLLHYRGAERLLGRLWGLPVVERRGGVAPEALLMEKYGIELPEGNAAGRTAHVFTHRRWEMDIVRFRIEDAAMFDSPDWALVDWASLDGKPVPEAFMKILRAARGERNADG